MRPSAPQAFLQYRIFAELEVLGKIADRVIVGDADHACVRPFLAVYHPEECCLSMAIPAHEPDPLPGIDRKTDIVEYYLSAVRLRKITDLYHVYILLRMSYVKILVCRSLFLSFKNYTGREKPLPG